MGEFKTDLITKLEEHQLQEHGISKYTGKHSCPSCDFKTNTLENLRKHRAKLHDDYTHPCKLCDFKTYKPTHLSKHMLNEHGISKWEGKFTCPSCDYKTNDNRRLSIHRYNLH